jgi:hypothetical protein
MNGFRLFLVVLICFVLLISFAILYGIALARTASASSTTPHFTDAFLYIATGLASFVGGVVAVGFGQKPPDGGTRVVALGGIVFPKQPEQWQKILGGIYALVYVIWGFAAIIIWALKSDVAADVVRNLAVITFGLVIAIATSFLRPA